MVFTTLELAPLDIRTLLIKYNCYAHVAVLRTRSLNSGSTIADWLYIATAVAAQRQGTWRTAGDFSMCREWWHDCSC